MGLVHQHSSQSTKTVGTTTSGKGSYSNHVAATKCETKCNKHNYIFTVPIRKGFETLSFVSLITALACTSKIIQQDEFCIVTECHKVQVHVQGDTKKLELLKNPTKIEEIQEKKIIDRN